MVGLYYCASYNECQGLVFYYCVSYTECQELVCVIVCLTLSKAGAQCKKNISKMVTPKEARFVIV